MYLALFLICQKFEPFKAELFEKHVVWPSGYLCVIEDSLFIRVIRKKILVFNVVNGKREKEIVPPDGQKIHSFGATPEEVHMSTYGEGGTRFLRIERETGKIKEESNVYYLFIADDTEYRVALNDYKKEGYPKVITTDKKRHPFFKKPEGYLRFPEKLNIWVTKVEGSLFIVSPSINKLFVHNDTIEELDRKVNNYSKGYAPFKMLTLKKYIKPREIITNRTTSTATALLLSQRTRLQQQFIVFFSRVGKGWVVCYEIPDEVNGVTIGNHLGIQFFNEAFEPTQFTERYGQVVGVHRDSLLILYPDGIQTNSQKAHYGLTGMESTEDLRKLQARYNQWQEQELRVSLEWVKPAMP